MQGFLLSLALALAPAPSTGCMADGPDGYVSGLIWQTEMSVIPDGATMMRVSFQQGIRRTWMGFTADVLEGPEELVGERLQITPLNANSCVGLGQREGYIVLLDEQIERDVEGELVRFYQAIDYRPSPENERQRRRGGEPWVYPGEPMEEANWFE